METFSTCIRVTNKTRDKWLREKREGETFECYLLRRMEDLEKYEARSKARTRKTGITLEGAVNV